jgi:predicted O-methyltransferase YrrM
MDFLPEDLNEYIEKHTRDEGEVLKALDRETYLKVLMPRMLSGHIQGQVLRMFSLMIQPETILEIGTFTGYSAICLAEGLVSEGKLHTIDINEELKPMVQSYFKKAGVSDKIVYHIGNALEIIPKLDMLFDLVFIDADKENYSNYFDLVIDKVRPGGYIIADNVLWSGKVIQPKPDEETMALMAFNEKVHADKRVENVLVPVRDGLMVMRKL